MKTRYLTEVASQGRDSAKSRRMFPFVWRGIVSLAAFGLLTIGQTAVGRAAPKKPRRIGGPTAHEVYNKTGTKRLPEYEGKNWKDTLKLVAQSARKPVLITGAKLQKRGGFKVYIGDLPAGENNTSDFGAGGKGYNGLTGTLEVRVARKNQKTKIITRIGWVGYPYQQKAPFEGKLAKRPLPDPSALLIHLDDNAQASTWSYAPRCASLQDRPPRVGELHRAVFAHPKLFMKVIEACADNHAVQELLNFSLRASDQGRKEGVDTEDIYPTQGSIDFAAIAGASTQEIALYSRALRRMVYYNGGIDPFGFGIKPNPAPQFAKPQEVFPELELALQKRYLGATPLPSTYSKILAALHTHGISDINPVLKWLAERPMTEWTDTGFMDAIRRTWKAHTDGAVGYLVQQLQTDKIRPQGLHGSNFEQFQTESFNPQKLLSELPLLIHFADRAKRGEPLSAELFARTICSPKDVAEKLQIVQASEAVPDRYVDSLFNVSRPIEGLRVALDFADQPQASVVALTEPSLPDDMAFDLAKRRWGSRDDAIEVVNKLSATQRAKQFIETVSYFVTYGGLEKTALTHVNIQGNAIPLIENNLAAEIRVNPAIEFELTREFWNALKTAHHEMIDAVEFDRLSTGMPIHQLHKRKQLLLWYLNHKYEFSQSCKTNSAEKNTNKFSNKILNAALRSSRSEESIVDILLNVGAVPIIGQKTLHAAISARTAPEQLMQLVYEADQHDMTETELRSLILEPLHHAKELLRYLGGLTKEQRGKTINNYHHGRLNWSDVAVFAANSTTGTLAHMLARRMSPELLLPVQNAILAAAKGDLSQPIYDAIPQQLLELPHESLAIVVGALSEKRFRNIRPAWKNEFALALATRIKSNNQQPIAERSVVASNVTMKDQKQKQKPNLVGSAQEPPAASCLQQEKTKTNAAKPKSTAKELSTPVSRAKTIHEDMTPAVHPCERSSDASEDLLDVLYVNADLLPDIGRIERAIETLRTRGKSASEELSAILSEVRLSDGSPVPADLSQILVRHGSNGLAAKADIWTTWSEAGTKRGSRRLPVPKLRRRDVLTLWPLNITNSSTRAWDSLFVAFDLFARASGKSFADLVTPLLAHEQLHDGIILKELAKHISFDMKESAIKRLNGKTIESFCNRVAAHMSADASSSTVKSALKTALVGLVGNDDAR